MRDGESNKVDRDFNLFLYFIELTDSFIVRWTYIESHDILEVFNLEDFCEESTLSLKGGASASCIFVYVFLNRYYSMGYLECGIVGLPNVGKSSLFNALTGLAIPSSNYPFCTIDPNVGIVAVKDDRLIRLSEMFESEAIIYSDIKFVDIAGLVKGASQGEGLGNRFLAHIRETGAIAHVVRCFECSKITHVSGKIDPIDDIEIINLELILADLSSVKNIRDRTEKALKSNKELLPVIHLMDRLLLQLESGKPLRLLDFSSTEYELLKIYPFLTMKPVVYIANVDEASLPEMDNQYVRAVKDYALADGSQVITVCARFEEELIELSPEEQKDFLLSAGLEESCLKRLIKQSFETLNLISYFTAGPKESRSWTIKKGSNAAIAAGAIHTDIQKGFIRAEVVSFDDIVRLGGRNEARAAGVLRSEGKDYIVQDGDVILFLHK